MDIKGLNDVFVAGVNDVDAKTFTTLLYGYEIRGKIRVPTIPTVEFFFYGNVDIEDPSVTREFIEGFEDKFGHAKFRFTDKYVSILLDIGSLDAPKVKERLSAVGTFMIGNGFGAIGLQPEEPEPEPEPLVDAAKIQAKPQPKMQPIQQQRQVQQQRQPVQQQQQQQQPVYQEPQVPFESYKVLNKLADIFLMGVNKVTNNTFTTLYHGYNVVGKMLSPVKDDIEIIFYGELTKNVTDEFPQFEKEMNEKYGKFPVRMVGGSCDAILYFDGKDVSQCKEMLGQISGFMMRNNIVAINLPNTVGTPVATYTAESLKYAKEHPGQGSGARGVAQNSRPTPPQQQSFSPQPMNRPQPTGGNDGGMGKFFKKFSKKP